MVAPADRPPLVAPLDEPVGFEDAADRPDLARRLHRVLAFDFAHLPEIADLWVESWARTLPAIDFEARRVWFCTHVDEALRKGAKIRVALVETGDVVGFVLIDPATGYLDQIAVHPDLWGEGIAEALLDAARALSPARIRLDVNTDNPRAVAFYLREGFREIGRGVNPRSGLATIALEWRPG
ncbi:GNAT family N-acetyltransferase [Siculibacillus lacustris]|uniref:GNAT family N-acetyltransferase n=2 Tax=Siculibacillus lacustris TaxID=1549641 RepID=A0A4Q9VJ96_9HYPH|nr:GNAT family N-acetyltransferase [Siculibacillus lacustris]